MADDEQEPYVDPNSGLAANLPGSYAHTPWAEGDDENEDPNPDPGGAEAIFATDGQQEATPVDDETGEVIDDDELEDADEADLELNDPNPDPGGAEAELADGSNAAHDHAVETQAADPLPGEGDAELNNPRVEDGWTDGASPSQAPDANPGADEQVAGPKTEAADEPHKGASRAAWVEFARSKGAPEEELAEDGGLKRDELAAKYGSNA